MSYIKLACYSLEFYVASSEPAVSLVPKTLLPWINTISKLDDINLTAKAKTNAEEVTKRFQEKSKWYRMEVNTEKAE